jgi:hypothetical protein
LKTKDGVVEDSIHQGDLPTPLVCGLRGMMKLLGEDRSKKKILHFRSPTGNGLWSRSVSGALASKARRALRTVLPCFSCVHGRLLCVGVTLLP